LIIYKIYTRKLQRVSTLALC